jgi:hypothetical protein
MRVTETGSSWLILRAPLAALESKLAIPNWVKPSSPVPPSVVMEAPKMKLTT